MSVCLSITDEQRLQLLDVLSSAPPLPKSDAQIDAEREDIRDMHLRRYMSECSSGLWRVGGPDAEF
jgi:hypothetical protein